MNFVLIFCNSTASRLIYAYSHYNMCAGGGCMYQISNEKFGLFVTVIIPGLFEPPVRTLRATIPENESHIFR